MTILDVGSAISYTIPSFPVFTVRLRHLRYKYVDGNGTVFVNDGFIRDCSALNRTYPAMVLVKRGYSCAFLTKVCVL